MLSYYQISIFIIFTLLNNKTKCQKYSIANNSNYNFICNTNSSCNNNGYCLNQTHCDCFAGYLTVIDNNSTNNINDQCNYKAQTVSKMFLLSFFFGPLAIEQFLLGNIALALCKLLLPLICFVAGTFLFLIGKKRDNIYLKLFGKLIDLTGTSIIFSWWFIDWILILNGNYTDENDLLLFKDL